MKVESRFQHDKPGKRKSAKIGVLLKRIRFIRVLMLFSY